MKTFNYLTLLLFCTLGSSFAYAQATTETDSVCVGATGIVYQVTGTAGSTYNWIVTNGTIASGVNTDSITINWSSTPGTDTLMVIESNIIGCPGDTLKLAVVRLPLPTVVISGTDSICLNSATIASKLTMTFTGVSPWTVAYTEDGNNLSVTTTANPYTFNSNVFTTSGNKAYTITNITGRKGCTGSGSGAAEVTVFPKPSTSLIRHF